MAANDAEIEQYLNEISTYPLLTFEDEISLAKRIAAGDEEARHDMIRSNLRLVVSIAKKYNDRGMSLLDLIEEGNLGLLKAVTRFNPDEGCKFSTYATWWIKQTIRRALINKVKPVRVPAYMFEEISRWKKTASMLSQTLGREATSEEIGIHLELSKQKIAIIRKALGATAPISRAGGDSENSMDLDNLISDTPDRQQEEVEEVEEWDLEALRSAMDLGLTDRERQVVELRYGMGGQPAKPGTMTLEEIGDKIGLTRERVRQIEGHALRKLQVFIQTKRYQEAVERHARLVPNKNRPVPPPEIPIGMDGTRIPHKPLKRRRAKRSDA